MTVLDPVAGALIALDFDGTLAPIVGDPQAARPVPGVIRTLAALAGAGARIAVVTGRDALTVLELGQLDRVPGLVISGLHGAESWQDGELTTIAEPAGLAWLRGSLPPLLPAGVWIEDKRLSLVLHTRRADNPQQALAELDRLRPLVSEQGLEAHAGKQVLELRIPGLSKATALDELLTPDTTAALFAGDDLGDLPAVAAVGAWSRRTGRPACTIAVGEVAELRGVTDRQLDSPAELAELLRTLIPT
ncbi:MAG: trehalose-phosphatase [Actinomycetota bacterium]|nr:trehalose-phosphatase [Actinomycetota bacterium]MDQ2958415.1 trehalose-phosphatase [Actinomycetota bacterium]